MRRFPFGGHAEQASPDPDREIDPANLVQNIQQVFQAIEEGIRTLRQIELAVQAVTGTDFSISPQIQAALGDVTRVLNSEVVGIVFQELEALEQFREVYPEVFDAIDSFEDLVTLVQQQSNNLLSASRVAVATQSGSVEAIEAILNDVETSLAESTIAGGQTEAIVDLERFTTRPAYIGGPGRCGLAEQRRQFVGQLVDVGDGAVEAQIVESLGNLGERAVRGMAPLPLPAGHESEYLYFRYQVVLLPPGETAL